jgi:hypothetical protein
VPAEPLPPEGPPSFPTRVRRGLARRLDPPPPAEPVRARQVRALELMIQRLEDGTATPAERARLRKLVRAFERYRRRRARAGLTPEQRRQRRLRSASLTELAERQRTDKFGVHFYTPHYERHLQHLRDEEFTLLEIGIGGYSRERQGGASLRMWKQFFQRATIVGLDIEDKSFVEEDRIHAVVGSQTDETALRRAIEAHGVPLVVIDDGSHVPADVVATFHLLFPLLPDGAVYAIEDTQTSYWPHWGGSMDRQDPTTTMALVKDLIDGLNYEEFLDKGYQPSYSDTHVTGVSAYHNLVFVQKGRNQEGSRRHDLEQKRTYRRMRRQARRAARAEAAASDG